jgi:hypothetical protein
MTSKGLIMKVEKGHVVVLTDDHDYVNLKLKDHVAIGQKIYFTEEDIWESIALRSFGLLSHKSILSVASLFIIMVLIGGIWGFNGLNLSPFPTVASTELGTAPTESFILPIEDIRVATVLTIDINPSVKLSLDQDDVVLSVKAMNDDAKTLNFDGIVGMTAEKAVEHIVTLARESGFINADDLEDDYVLITTVPMTDKSQQKLDGLTDKLEAKIAESPELQNVNVALMKADKRDLFEAEGKKIPFGLYVVNGQVEIEDGKYLTVKEYFADTKHVEDFKDKGQIIDKKSENQMALARKFIKKLDAAGAQTNDLLTDLDAKNVDIDAVLTKIKTRWSEIEAQTGENEQTNPTESHNGPPSDTPGNGQGKNKNKGN